MKTEPKNTTKIENKGGEGPGTDPAAIRTELLGVKSKLDELAAALAKTPNADEVGQLKSQIDAITATVGDIGGNYDGLIKALNDRVDELQTGAALLGTKAADQPSGIMKITRDIMESDVYKSIFDAKGQRAGQVAQVGNYSAPLMVESYTAARYKAASPVVISDMAGGNLTAFRPGTIEAREFAMSLFGRIPTQIIQGATTVSIDKETLPSRYGAWKSELAATLDGDPTPVSTATFTDTEGLMVGSTVQFWSATDTLLGSAVVVSFDPVTDIVTFVTNSITWDGTIGWKVSSENYAAIPELGEKGNQFVGTAATTFTMKMIPSILPTTVNAINTVQGLQALIERKMPLRDMRNMSRHLLYGDDSAPQLQGLRPYTGAQSSLWSGGVTGDNQLDAVMRAANLIPWGVQLSCIMSQADLPALYLLKGTDGHYLRTGNFGMVPLTNVSGAWFLGPIELVFDFACTSGDFTVINFSGASEIADQNTSSLMWGYINDDFVKNIIRARYEATRAHVILDTNEYVVGEWDAAP